MLTVGSGQGCDVDSQFHKVSSSKRTCRNTPIDVTGVVFKTGFKSACINDTSEVTSAVSVVHRLSEYISDSSSNSSGNGDVNPPSRGRCRDSGRNGWVQVVGEILQFMSVVGWLSFSGNPGP